jgi:hypothetical protein
MASSLKVLVILSLFLTGLCCPAFLVSAASNDDCGHGHPQETEFSAPAEVMPCCLVGREANNPGVFFEHPVSPTFLVKLNSDEDEADPDRLIRYAFRWDKYRDKFEERNCNKRE